MTTIRNEFHGTEYRTNLTLAELRDVDRAICCGGRDEARRARRTARRIEKHLCGIDGCTCGDSFGARPNYEAQLDR